MNNSWGQQRPEIRNCYLDAVHERHENGRHAVILKKDCSAVCSALLTEEGLEPWKQEGRGTVYRFQLGDGVGVFRRYQRGGFIRHFLKDLYFLDNRPLRELAITAYAWHGGLPIPEPLGVCWNRVGPFFRGGIATRWVDSAMLLDLLRAKTVPNELLLRVGSVIRQMHEMGIYHADLQVRNILVSEDQPLLLDFDNARRYSSLKDADRARNLLRLRRSFDKNGLPQELYQVILRGYGPLPEVYGQLDMAYRAKGRVSDAMGSRKH